MPVISITQKDGLSPGVQASLDNTVKRPSATPPHPSGKRRESEAGEEKQSQYSGTKHGFGASLDHKARPYLQGEERDGGGGEKPANLGSDGTRL